MCMYVCIRYKVVETSYNSRELDWFWQSSCERLASGILFIYSDGTVVTLTGLDEVEGTWRKDCCVNVQWWPCVAA